jgi:tetratricopeptide (TPR) repeat protein
MVSPTPTPDDPARELRSLVATGRFQEAFDRFQNGGAGLAREPEAALMAATAATRLGRYGAAISVAESALAQFHARGDRDGRMRALNLLGVIAFERGHLDEAERNLGEALELARELDDSLMAARASNNLASLAQLGEKPEVALSLYRSALVSYQRLGDRRGMAETHHNLGLVFRQMGRLHDARETVEQAVRLADGAADGSLRALTLTGQAELYLGLGEVARARQNATVAQQLAQGTGDEIGAAEAGRLRALVGLEEGDLDLALAEAQAARSTAARHGSALLQGESAAAAARVLRALGRVAEAEVLRAEARGLFERLGAVIWLREFDAAWQGTQEK